MKKSRVVGIVKGVGISSFFPLTSSIIKLFHHPSAIRHPTSLSHQTSSILPMNVEADFIKVALDSRLNKQGVTMYLQLHSANFNKE
jgi:hypothetical protein